MLTASARPFDTSTILDGLGVDSRGAHTHYNRMSMSSIEPWARLLHRLYQTLR
jgi:glutamate carboxypeptidase